jgi:hypothetical protein
MSFIIGKKFNIFFVNKNWPNGCKVSCKSLSNLLECIGINANLKKRVGTI